MSKSNARKKREHFARNTGYNMAAHRGFMPDFSTHVRKTSTKKEQLEKMNKKHKGKNSFDRYESGKKEFFSFIESSEPIGACHVFSFLSYNLAT